MNKLFLVFKKELREVFRDKKSLAMMLIIPFMIPLIIIGMSALFESEVNKDVNEYNLIGFNYEFNEIENNLAKELNVDVTYKNQEELKESFDKGEIYAYIVKEDNKYTIYYDNSNTDSNYASSLAQSFLESYKGILQTNYLTNNNIDIDTYNNLLNYEYSSIEKQNFYANYVVNYAFLFIIMAITVSATYPATDTTAGEKERGTLETLLTFPIKSKDIILGKLLSVTVSSIITGILSLILGLISLTYVFKTYDIYEDVFLINGNIIIVSLLIILSYSLLISGLCIAVASLSKTFKEAQSALTPLTFISFFPGMITSLMEIKNSALLSLIPFVNFSMIFQDVSKGDINYLYILLMFISTFIFIALVISYIIKQYKSEKVLFTN